MRIQVVYVAPKRESWESQSRAGRHNPATVVRWIDGRRHVLPVGTEDDWQLYESLDDQGGRYYCVSINRRLSYVGVQAYDKGDQEAREEMGAYFQGEAVDDLLGRTALDRLTDRTIARYLIEHLEAVLCG